ncbi:DNA ligase D [Lysobacter soyae]|uniref:DNA ligase (ATP) n=1 Tax=Lysobacter soyae TaxID=2764185 RepID=A0ABX8WS21_9GAMM|nr:DNA ligase D [Lysobacter sp. CJ11]QYR53623.1 DNA ligase D [Lysobacter sp. CJ11]
MALEAYRKKRSFSKTPEPDGLAMRRKRAARDLSFVVQLHHASHRHYDFRLELGGVLKSWAVPKGPSFDPSVKRMAVEVEDHPLDYAGFEGKIPHDQYGGGHVAVFDAGTWTPIGGDAFEMVEKGHLKFDLHGERLKGQWHLVRTRKSATKPQWLLFKSDDAWAGPIEADDLLEGVTLPDAVDLARARRPGKRSALHSNKAVSAKRKRSSSPPAPMLARLVDRPPVGSGWIHEIKWDGYRIVAILRHGKARLYSRNGLDWSTKMPAVVEAVEALNIDDAILDGEVIAGKGTREDFNALQAALKAGRSDALVYMAFDLLEVDGEDLRELPLSVRKARLKALLDGRNGGVGFTQVAKSSADRALQIAVNAGYEGIISKREDSRYMAGRSEDWLKTKAIASDEFAIVGYTHPKGGRKGIGALLLATPEGKSGWRYVGRVGSGISDDVLSAFARTLDGHGTPRPTVRVPENDTDLSKALWIPPEGVVEVYVRGFGGNGLLRQASFKTVRPDKRAEDLRSPDVAVSLSSPEKILFPESGITKQQVWDYYNAVMDWFLPEIEGRPLSLVRCPGGIDGNCFFQKHATADMRSASAKPPKTSASLDADTPVVHSEDDVRILVQFNTLEFHPWGARAESPEHADGLVFDLDPDPGLPWKEVVRAAREVHDNLRKASLASFVRTSGGKGLHVFVPLNPPVPWSDAKPFAEAFAKTMVALHPDRYTATANKAKRTGRIFIDWLRNGRGSTSVASFSLRARAGAPLAMPLAWSELGRTEGGDVFNLANALPRMAAWSTHPWGDYRALKQTLRHSD